MSPGIGHLLGIACRGPSGPVRPTTPFACRPKAEYGTFRGVWIKGKNLARMFLCQLRELNMSYSLHSKLLVTLIFYVHNFYCAYR